MALDGECIYECFYLIKDDPTGTTPSLSLPTSSINDCCNVYQLKVLADTSTTDFLKNDENGFIWAYNALVTSAIVNLEKFTNGVYVTVATLSNDTYGTNYTFGFKESDGNKYIGYQLKWREVLILHGEGNYRLRVEKTILATTYNDYTNVYCLKQYSPNIANGTIRLEWFTNGIMGISNNDSNTFDYLDLNWKNSLRINGSFGFPKSNYTKDFVQYNGGDRHWVEDEQEVEYRLSIHHAPSFIHDIMRTEVLQSDELLITDYNNKNAENLIRKKVFLSSEYAPQWHIMQNKLANVEVTMKQAYNNLRKKRC